MFSIALFICSSIFVGFLPRNIIKYCTPLLSDQSLWLVLYKCIITGGERIKIFGIMIIEIYLICVP